MELEKYEMVKEASSFTYAFYSEGPMGKIKKIIRFQQLKELGKNVFNLAFGDLEENAGRLNDLAISNNSDRIKVLNTVAHAYKMPRKESHTTHSVKISVPIVNDLPDHEHDPVFIKKIEEAYKDLREAPLPDFIKQKIVKPD